ncbi:hypothetical protein ACIQ1J_23320 [Streptomyces sp. NPDC097107]|uniref:hypothetical protein n=1 Tax=Streptomyces sp. NPDC097107 TaxID=3366089 RepID=UPI003829BFEB
MTQVADHVLQRLSEWGVQRVYGCPGDGVNGPLGWDEALAADRPVVSEVKVDAEIAPIPPHITRERGEKAVKAARHDPQASGIATKGVRHKLTEYAEHLPGRGKK